MPYIAIGQSNDPTIYGTGESADAARADARQWIDAEADTADLTVVRCTQALHHQVMDQGACDYEEIGGTAYTEAEAAAVNDGLDVDEEGVATGEVELHGPEAKHLGIAPEVYVTIAQGSMTVRYTTAGDVAHEVSDEPGCPEQQARAYDWHLRNVGAAVTELVRVGLRRDAELEAEEA